MNFSGLTNRTPDRKMLIQVHSLLRYELMGWTGQISGSLTIQLPQLIPTFLLPNSPNYKPHSFNPNFKSLIAFPLAIILKLSSSSSPLLSRLFHHSCPSWIFSYGASKLIHFQLQSDKPIEKSTQSTPRRSIVNWRSLVLKFPEVVT